MIYVVNLRGEREPFSLRKVYKSAQNAGASKELAFEIAKIIEKEIYDGISTSQIFDRIYELLLTKSPQSAIRFNLKKAIQRLGPTGFSFEKYIAEIFKSLGYKVKINQYILGLCVKYEIDFLAEKGNILYIGECKYHNLPGGRVDLQIALANFARFLDIKNGKTLNSNLNYKSILVTNTKFTLETIKYSNCVGVELLGWKYPQNRGLEKIIEENKFYPITILPSVDINFANIFISNGIVLVRDILKIEPEKLQKRVNISKSKLFKIKKEAEILLNN
ncbi:MAG: ATP cone domain-containing protein [Minisyncoccia bacterium]